MTAQIIQLATPAELDQQGVVDLLEEYLELARCGQLSGVALAAVTTDRRARVAHSRPSNCLSLLGAVRLLEGMCTAAILEEAE